ncbi:DNA replication protein [Treponema bryantii]|nr:DNA replication protein [Treponema bryantii]
MPATARCLYFTLNMVADDDGFVDSPKAIMRQCMASEDDLKILIAKFFLIPFDSGIVVIRHWRINNYLRSDRYTETKYLNEKSTLEVEKTGAYKCNQPVKVAETPQRVPLTERVPKNDIERVEKEYALNYQQLYERGVVKSEKPIVNWAQSRKLTKDCIEKYGLEKILDAVRRSIDNKFIVSKGYVLTTILSAGMLAQLINATDGRIDNDSDVGEVDF